MPATRGTIVRALRIETRRIRSLGMVALAAPLVLGACVAENNAMRSSALARKPQAAAPTGGPDAYGYAPVRLAALEDGMHVALPSAKPDWDRLQAAAKTQATSAAAPAAASLRASRAVIRASAPAVAESQAGASQQPSDEIAALKADVAERRASLVMMTVGKGDRRPGRPAEATTPAAAPQPGEAPAATAGSVSRVASARDILDPRKSVPAALSTVAQSADAVKVAAVDTTSAALNGTKRAFDVVQSRIGDTFMADDSITGSASIDRMIEKSAADNNIPSELAYAVVRVESHYKPNVVGGGAYGLSQIKPATARSLGFEGPAKGLFDPETNLRYGMKYLAGAWEMSGHDVCGTAMRYKGGHRTTTMTRAAADYCSSVKRHMAAIERRRAPANRETLVAAAERQKHIGEAGRRLVDFNARARILAANVAVPSAVATGPVAVAAATQAGRAVSASGVPQMRATAATTTVASYAGSPKAGRLVRVYGDGSATPTTVSATGRFGYAD